MPSRCHYNAPLARSAACVALKCLLTVLFAASFISAWIEFYRQDLDYSAAQCSIDVFTSLPLNQFCGNFTKTDCLALRPTAAPGLEGVFEVMGASTMYRVFIFFPGFAMLVAFAIYLTHDCFLLCNHHEMTHEQLGAYTGWKTRGWRFGSRLRFILSFSLALVGAFTGVFALIYLFRGTYHDDLEPNTVDCSCTCIWRLPPSRRLGLAASLGVVCISATWQAVKTIPIRITQVQWTDIMSYLLCKRIWPMDVPSLLTIEYEVPVVYVREIADHRDDFVMVSAHHFVEAKDVHELDELWDKTDDADGLRSELV